MTQYSGVYTLQQQGQALTSGQWATDPYYKNTTLLLHADGVAGGAQNNTFLDSSTNAFAITRNGNTTQGSFTPYGPDWSNYLPGSAYFTAPAATANLGSGNFTVEFWWNGDCSGATGFTFDTASVNTTSTWQCFTQSNQIYWQTQIGVGALFVTNTLSINSGWHHIAIVRTSGVFAVYVDGTSVGLSSGTYNDTTNYNNASSLYIGYRSDNQFSVGYYSNVRITNTAVYSGNFTPSTVPLTAIDGTKILTCQSNQFVDTFLSSAKMYYQTSASSTAAFSSSNLLGYLPTSGASQQLYDLDIGSSVTTFVASYSSSFSGVTILASADGTTWTTLYASGSQANTTLSNGGTPFRYVRWWYSGGTWAFGLSNRSITVNGTPSVQRFSPFPPQYQYTTAVIGGSGYFDGTGDYLTLSNVAALQPGASTTPFSVEAWFYVPAGTSTASTALLGNYTVTSYPTNTNGFDLVSGSDSTIGLRWGYPNYADSGTATFNKGQWNHVAVCRNSSGSMSCYLNGTRWFNTSSNTSITTATASSFWIGWAGSLSGTTVNPFPGYIGDVRFLKGSTAYDPTSSTLTVPTAPLTAITDTQLLCNMTNAGIYDNAMMNNLETVGNAQVSTSVVKYGSGSLKFDGTAGWLAFPTTPQWSLGTGDFTVEMWVNLASTNTTYVLIGNGGYNSSAANVAGWSIQFNTGGTYFGFNAAGNSYWFISNNAAAIAATFPIGSWVHVAMVRQSGVLTCYINGKVLGSPTVVTDSCSTSSYTPKIGTDVSSSSGYYMNGYIDEVRITKGLARYTAPFIPPKVAFSNQ